MDPLLLKSVQLSERTKYMIISLYAASIAAAGFLFNSPAEIAEGLLAIVQSPSILLSDYFIVGNIGAALFNSGILMLAAIFLASKNESLMNGPIIAAIFTIGGFALFGKNIYNTASIILGVYLHSKINKDHFAKYIIIAFFGTALAPLVSQVSFGFGLNPIIGIITGNLFGVGIGMILPPLASSFVRFHQGFNLYNIGFTAGITGMLFMSIFRTLGYENTSPSQVYLEFNPLLAGLYSVIFVSMILLKYRASDKPISYYKKLMSHSGRLVTDFVSLNGFGYSMFNMGVMGLIGLAYVYLVGGQLNGPVIGGIFTLVGFGAFGKHPKNSIPVMAGVFLTASFFGQGASSTGAILTALFATALAPIAGQYGPLAGIVAGFIHMSIVTNTGYLHGGMNLYNNGFTAGFVAAIMVPVLEAYRKENPNEG
jgi:hypothetical protein